MELKLKTAVAIIISVMISMTCMSAFASGWSGRHLTKLIKHRDDRVVTAISLYGPWSNPDQCDRDDKAILDPGLVNASSYKETYAMLLAAHLTGREINVLFDGCTNVNGSSFPAVKELVIY